MALTMCANGAPLRDDTNVSKLCCKKTAELPVRDYVCVRTLTPPPRSNIMRELN